MIEGLLSPRALPDRGWRFLLRGGIAVEHYSGRVTAGGYLFQERKIAGEMLGVVDPRLVIRSTTIELSGTVDPGVMETARNKRRHVTGDLCAEEGGTQVWRFTPTIDPWHGYGLWVGIVVNLWCAGEYVGDTTLISPTIPLRGTDWDGPKPSL